MNRTDKPNQDECRQREVVNFEHAEKVNHALFEISNAVNTTLNLKALYQLIHTSLAKIIDVTNFYIAIVDSPKRTLYFPYYVDTVDDDCSPVTDFDTDTSLTGLVVIKQNPILLKKQALQDRADKKAVMGILPLIWMGVPLLIKNTVIGVVALQSYTDPELFNHQDLQILSAVSHQIAIAIDRKRSYDELTKSEQRYRQLFDYATDSIVIIEPRGGRFIDSNRNAHKLLGYSKNELLQLTVSDLHADLNTKEMRGIIDNQLHGQNMRFEAIYKSKDGTLIPVELSSTSIVWKERKVVQAFIRDISERRKAEEERELLIDKLQKALDEIKTLRGILPICSHCKRIRDDTGYWNRIESYISRHTDADFSHSICPECAKKFYPDFDLYGD